MTETAGKSIDNWMYKEHGWLERNHSKAYVGLWQSRDGDVSAVAICSRYGEHLLVLLVVNIVYALEKP